jgi:hypothetical protein
MALLISKSCREKYPQITHIRERQPRRRKLLNWILFVVTLCHLGNLRTNYSGHAAP